MEPILSALADKAPRTEQRDLLSRLYREIGISAVAAALEISGTALDVPQSAKDRRAALQKKAA